MGEYNVATSTNQIKLVVNFASSLARCTYMAGLEQSSMHTASIGTEIVGIPLWRPVLEILPPNLMEWAILTWSNDKPTQIHWLDQATAIVSISTGVFPRRRLLSRDLTQALLLEEVSSSQLMQSLMLWMAARFDASHWQWQAELESLLQDALDALTAMNRIKT